jgi:hypothetical protein
MHIIFYCPFAKDCWGVWNFQFAEQLSTPQIFQDWKTLQNVSFALDIFHPDLLGNMDDEE